MVVAMTHVLAISQALPKEQSRSGAWQQRQPLTWELRGCREQSSVQRTPAAWSTAHVEWVCRSNNPSKMLPW